MKRFAIPCLFAATLMAVVSHSQATLSGFTDYALGGTTASWDIFYGGNYLPTFNYQTGTVGNPILDSAGPLEMNVVVNSWQPGPPMPSTAQATGPLDSDESTVPGDRELFYTFFSSLATWQIAGTVEQTLTQFVFQVHELDVASSSMSNVLLNGVGASSFGFDDGSDIGTWTWTGLNVLAGENFDLGWTTGSHSGYDAFQIQMDASAVPEPTAGVLGLVGLALLTVISRCRTQRYCRSEDRI